MDPESFKTLIESLRCNPDIRGAAGEMRTLMVPFDGVEDGLLDCPWLKWAMKELDDPVTPRGILIMQDWGLQGETIDEAVSVIDAYSKNALLDDRTLSNLFATEAWKAAILERSILVTNAVWGLRPSTDDAPNKICGYLGAAIHKRAFLRWGALVAQLSTRTQNGDDFRLYVAGEWARFDGKENRSGTRISDYLRCWKQWASNYSEKVAHHEFPSELNDDFIEKCHGRVVFLSHPCTWNYRFESDPFTSLDSMPAG
jgi:hypothetical protein